MMENGNETMDFAIYLEFAKHIYGRNKMNELIKIIINKEGKRLVSARELYEFLEVKDKFATWFKRRVVKYHFEENVNYITTEGYSPNCEKGGRPTNEYIITIEMAKELSMVENNDKRHQARRYFIACEEKLKEIVKPALPSYTEVLSN